MVLVTSFFLTFGTPFFFFWHPLFFLLVPLLYDLTGTPGGYTASGGGNRKTIASTPGTEKKVKKTKTDNNDLSGYFSEEDIPEKKSNSDSDSDSDSDEIPDPSPQKNPIPMNDEEDTKDNKKPKQSWKDFEGQTFERYIHVTDGFKRIRGTVVGSGGAGNPGPGGPRLKIQYSELVRNCHTYTVCDIADDDDLNTLSLVQVMSANIFQQYQMETDFYETYGAVHSIYGAVHTPIDDGKFKKDYLVQFTNFPGVPVLVDGLADGFFVEVDEPNHKDRDSDFEKHFGYEPILLTKSDVNATENNHMELTLEINKKSIKSFMTNSSFQIAGIGNPEKTSDVVFSFKTYNRQDDPRQLLVTYRFLTVSQDTFKTLIKNCGSDTVKSKMIEQMKAIMKAVKDNDTYLTEDTMWYFCEESVNKIKDEDEEDE